MLERLETHLAHLVTIDWDDPSKRDFGSDDVSVTMHTLVLETCGLHKIVAKYLPPLAVKNLMNDLWKGYLVRLEATLKQIDLFSSSGKNRH